jgi:hypothetical protein
MFRLHLRHPQGAVHQDLKLPVVHLGVELPGDCVIFAEMKNLIALPIKFFFYLVYDSGFGGLGIPCWPLVPKFAGSNPAEAVGLKKKKKSSARLPSEGK